MNNPDDCGLPFFAYGLFKPGQLGFERIESFVSDCQLHCFVNGTLWLRDGIPLLESGIGDSVGGSLIFFRPEESRTAYGRVSEIEPDDQYRWGTVEVPIQAGKQERIQRANALLGRKPQRGSVAFQELDWDGHDDPLFNEGLDVVQETLSNNGVFNDDLKRLFRLQMAYLLLWSAIERYAGLRYHLGDRVMRKVEHIAKETVFVECISKLPDDQTRWVFRGDKPGEKAKFVRDNPDKVLDFYYQVRSNMTHRGKAEYADFYIIRQALSELFPIFRAMLDDAFKPHPVWH